jgi:putative chitinase
VFFRFDREKIFDGIRSHLDQFGGRIPKTGGAGSVLALPQATVDGLTETFGFIEADPEWKSLEEIAYCLATWSWETGNKFRAVKEGRARAGTKVRRIQDRYWLSGYYGRGRTQLTWERNYQRIDDRLILGGQLVKNPDLILEKPFLDYRQSSVAMREGLYTNRKLSNYIRPGHPPDFVGARATVNGNDKAEIIATRAELLLEILKNALIEQTDQIHVTTGPPAKPPNGPVTQTKP